MKTKYEVGQRVEYRQNGVWDGGVVSRVSEFMDGLDDKKSHIEVAITMDRMLPTKAGIVKTLDARGESDEIRYPVLKTHDPGKIKFRPYSAHFVVSREELEHHEAHAALDKHGLAYLHGPPLTYLHGPPLTGGCRPALQDRVRNVCAELDQVRAALKRQVAETEAAQAARAQAVAASEAEAHDAINRYWKDVGITPSPHDRLQTRVINLCVEARNLSGANAELRKGLAKLTAARDRDVAALTTDRAAVCKERDAALAQVAGLEQKLETQESYTRGVSESAQAKIDAALVERDAARQSNAWTLITAWHDHLTKVGVVENPEMIYRLDSLIAERDAARSSAGSFEKALAAAHIELNKVAQIWSPNSTSYLLKNRVWGVCEDLKKTRELAEARLKAGKEQDVIIAGLRAKVADLEKRERLAFVARTLNYYREGRGPRRITVDCVRLADAREIVQEPESIFFELIVDDRVREWFGNADTEALDRKIQSLALERDAALKKIDDIKAAAAAVVAVLS